MAEVNDRPCHARRAIKNGENEQPAEEEYEYVCGPYSWIHEPLRVPVQIRRRHRLHVQLSDHFALHC